MRIDLLLIAAGVLAAITSGCGRRTSDEVPSPARRSVDRIVDVQKLRLLDEPAHPRAEQELSADILVAGASLGGVAAALGACESGRTVVLTEETDWPGGQLSSQGIAAPDDHRYIETFGGTRLYYELRRRVRIAYARQYRLKPAAARAPYFSPGEGWVSRLTFEPRVAAAVIQEMLAPYRAGGRLTLLLRHKAVSAETAGNQVRSVTFRDLDGARHARVTARFVLDATDMGDLLPLTGTEYVAGAEDRQETGEPKARPDRPRLDCAQSFGYPFAMELTRAPATPVPPPPRYAEYREHQPYTFAHNDGSPHPPTFRMFHAGINVRGPFWAYRRALAAENFDDPKVSNDIAVILFAGNDYHGSWLIDQPPDRELAALQEARDLSRGFAHWLQTEAPRDEGGQGYPELALRPEVMGSEDGFSKFPYIREGRRIIASTRIREQDIGSRFHAESRAAIFADTIGIGWHGVDIHPGACGQAIAAQHTRPFQIPLGALIPERMENLLAAGKDIGTTHITNGAYRMHPTEWNVGESAGRLGAFCVENNLTPRRVEADADERRRFQASLVKWGVPIFWFVDVPQNHPAFAAAQLLGAWGEWPYARQTLSFDPERAISASEADRALRAAHLSPERIAGIMRRTGLIPAAGQVRAADLAREWLAAVYPGDG